MIIKIGKIDRNILQAVDDAGHEKNSIFKVKWLEAVDKATGQLAKLLWQAEATGKFQFSLCVTDNHSTPVEYGDHSFEPVPFTLCRLKDFVCNWWGKSSFTYFSWSVSSAHSQSWWGYWWV